MRTVMMLCLPVLAVAVAGCPWVSEPKTGRLRVVHASPDAPAVDVCADGAAAFQGATFPGATNYATLPVGTSAMRVAVAGSGCGSGGVISADLPLARGQDLTVVALNFLSQIEPLVLVDDNTRPGSGTARVRVVHASPNAPTVDVTLADGTTLVNNLSFKEASGYLQVPAGTYELQIRDETGEVVVLDLGGDPALTVLVTVDN